MTCLHLHRFGCTCILRIAKHDKFISTDQTITEEQFHQCIYKYLDKFRNTTPEKEANTIKEAFEFFDKNHDGIINRKELKNILLITEKGKTTKRTKALVAQSN